MLKRVIYLLTLLILAGAFSASAQEVLSASRIQARASRRHPALGLPVRSDGQIDPIIWHDAGAWKGADSRRAAPFWTMSSVGEATLPAVQVSAGPAQPSGPSAGPAQQIGRASCRERVLEYV